METTESTETKVNLEEALAAEILEEEALKELEANSEEEELEAFADEALKEIEDELEVEAQEPVLTDADLEAAVEDAEKVTEKQAAYAEQDEETVEAGELSEDDGKPAKKKKEAKPRAAKRDSFASTFEAVETLGKGALPPLDSDRINGLNKKTSDKAINIAEFIGSDKRLSVYTVQGAKHLLSSESGSVTMESMVKHLVDNGYTIKTARSQTSQVFALLPVFEMAKRDGGRLDAMLDNGLLAKVAI